MARDLISKKTRNEFREFLVGWVLRDIEAEFDAAGIAFDGAYQPDVGGERRSFVEQHYRTLDFSDHGDARKLLDVFENILHQLEQQMDSDNYATEVNADAKRDFDNLTQWLGRDGYEYARGRLLARGGHAHVRELQGLAAQLDATQLQKQVERIRASVDDDPGLAIGTAKELLETVCKTILAERGVAVDGGWDVTRLVKEARRHLGLLPDQIPDAAKGAASIKRLLSNLGTVAQSLGEIRNLYGTGHGKSGRAKGLAPRHARLAVGSASTLAVFLLDTHQERSGSPSDDADPKNGLGDQ